MERLQQQPRPRATATPTPTAGGIPVDSEYVVFVIDTSDSMVSSHWQDTIDVMREILDIYPSLKGLQVMNDRGIHMFEATAPGSWLQDSPGLRDRISGRLQGWKPYSESDPLPGIEQALKLYRAPGRNVSIVVIGDEYTGDSMQRAADRVAKLNAADQRPSARIHGIGFPAGAGMPEFTNIQFSALMRMLTTRNGGTFVGITRERPCLEYNEVLGEQRCVRR
jgi:hypothetical protein